MKKVTILQIGLVLLLFFLASFDLNAQLKVGMNPKTLSSNIYFEVESVQGNKFIITKDSAKVGIGTNNPSAKLEINNGTIPGAIKIIDGTEGVGKVLTSNASGVGTWNTPTVNTANVTNSKDITNSNGIIVTGGVGATLQSTSLRLDSAAIAKMINQSPVKDSLLKVINSNTTVGSTFNVSTRVLTTTVNGVTSSVTIPTTNDSTTASNGLTLNGKDIRLGGTLNTATTITQGANVLNFNATPTADYTAGINITNNAAGNPGVTILNMTSPNSDTSFFRIGKIISTGNVAEISYTHKGNNNDTNRLSFGFHSSRYLLNLMKNGNLSIGNTIATEKLDVDGGARIRNIASGATSDSIVTVDVNGVLRKRNISAVVTGDNWGTQTVAVSAPIAGNGTSGSPLSLTTNNTTAGQLVSVTNGTGATMTNMAIGIDTTALKTFINARTTVSNTFNTSSRALTTTVNGITGSSVTIPTTNDSTTASNGLTLNGKDVRLGGTLNTATTITQGTNTMTFTGTPSVGNSSVMTLSNTAIGSNGTVLLDMLTPNSDISYYRLGKSTTFGNSAEITFRTVGNNNDSNSLSLGFFNNQYLLNLTKNGNLGIGSNLYVPTQKLDVDGGARIRSLASGAASDSIVTSDANGVLRRRNLNSMIVNIYNTDGTLTGERTVTNNGNVLNFVGNGTSGFPIRLKSPQATSSEVSIGIYDRNSDTKGWMIGSNTYNGVTNANGNLSRELHFATLGFANSGVKMKIDSAGYVAIGRNIDPSVRLAIQGGLSLGNGNFLPDTAYYKDDNFVTFRHNGTSEDFIGYRNNTIYFADCPGGSDLANPTVMVLGNLGVGNTTPAAKLHVTGNARITSMSYGASTDSVVVVDANGELKKRDPLSIGSANQLSASLSATVPALSIGDVGNVTVTLAGAAVGDAVVVNPNSDLPAGVVIAYCRVSATNTIKIGFSGTGSSSSFTQTFDIKIIK